jgi:peptide chain release factor 1
MLDKIADIERKYEHLGAQLADPEVLGDHAQYTALAKERAELEEIVETYRAHAACVQELGDHRELAKDSDEEVAALAREEIPGLETRIADLEQKLKILLLPKDPWEGKNVIVEIRAGTGGDEASLFAGDLYNMYKRFAEGKGWTTELMSANPNEVGGYKEIVFSINGENVYRWLKYESGVHRVQRVPETEASGRKHTSTATVAVLPEADDVDVEVNEADLEIDRYRASGAGGQHVNRTESAIRITHLPSGIVVTCQDERSQHKNKAKAMKVLKSRLLEQAIREQEEAVASERRGQVGTGDRSERIRTYNFHQGRVTDHRIGLTLHKLDGILMGDLDELVDSLITHYQAEALKEQEG